MKTGCPVRAAGNEEKREAKGLRKKKYWLLIEKDDRLRWGAGGC